MINASRVCSKEKTPNPKPLLRDFKYLTVLSLTKIDSMLDHKLHFSQVFKSRIITLGFKEIEWLKLHKSMSTTKSSPSPIHSHPDLLLKILRKRVFLNKKVFLAKR